MRVHQWQWGWFLVLVACSRSNDPLPNKNTNWLNVCESADDCAAGQSCLCGICTTTCGAASECGRDGVEASCVPIVDLRLEAQCAANDHGDAVAICAAACEGTSDCEAIGPELACSQAVCVQSAFASLDAGVEAGMSGPDAAVGDAATSDAATASSVPDAEVADAMVDAASMPPDAGEDAGADAGATACAPCAEGWSCIDGMCAQILATDQPGLMAFVRDSERLYWVNYGSFDRLDNYQHDGSVVAMPIGGGEIVTLAEGRERPMGLAVDDAYAYWVDNTQPQEGELSTIMRVSLTGGAPEPIVSATYLSESIAVDDTYVYFLGEGDAPDKLWLKRTLKDGSGEPEELIARESLVNPRVRDLTVVGDALYWAGEFYSVFTAPKDGSGETSDFGTGATSSFAVEPGALYFADWTDLQAALYVERSGDERLTLARVSDTEVSFADYVDSFDMALDTEHVYWTWTRRDGDNAHGGALARSDKSVDDTVILWSSELLAQALLAIDDAHVYLAVRDMYTGNEGTVLRIAKE